MLDVFIAVVLVIGPVRGFFTGVVRQAASIAGLILAFIVSVQLMRPVGVLASDALDVSSRTGTVIAFVLLFVAIEVIVFLVSRLLERLLKVLRLSVLNRLAGGLIGGLKAALLLSVLFIISGYAGLPGREARNASALYRPVASTLPVAWNFIAERVPAIETLGQTFGFNIPATEPRS